MCFCICVSICLISLYRLNNFNLLLYFWSFSRLAMQLTWKMWERELHGSIYTQIFFNSKYCSTTGSVVGWICGGNCRYRGANIHYAWITPHCLRSAVFAELITSPCLTAPYSVCPSLVLIHWPSDDDLRCPQVPAANNSMTSTLARNEISGSQAFINLLWIC